MAQEPQQKLTAIYLEDDPAQAHLLARMLGLIDYMQVELQHFSRPERALAPLLSGKVDLLFLDYHLGAEQSGLDVLRYLRENKYEGPIVMLTSRDDGMLVQSFLSYGADAYLNKAELDPARIASTIQVAMRVPHKLTPRILKDRQRALD